MSLKHESFISSIAEFAPRFSVTRAGNPIHVEIDLRQVITEIALLVAGGASLHPPAQLVSAGVFEAWQLIVMAKVAEGAKPKRALLLTIHTDLEDNTAMTDQAAIAYMIHACIVRQFVDHAKAEDARKKDQGATAAAPSQSPASSAAATGEAPGKVVSFKDIKDIHIAEK